MDDEPHVEPRPTHPPSGARPFGSTRSSEATLRTVVVFLMSLTLVACSPIGLPPEDDAGRTALIEAVSNAEPGTEIDMRAVLGQGWDGLAIFGPYAYNDEARDALGFALDIEAMSPWTTSEGGALFVLVDGRRVTGWFPLPVADIGVHCLYGVHPASQARFVVRDDANGLREIASPNRQYC